MGRGHGVVPRGLGTTFAIMATTGYIFSLFVEWGSLRTIFPDKEETPPLLLRRLPLGGANNPRLIIFVSRLNHSDTMKKAPFTNIPIHARLLPLSNTVSKASKTRATCSPAIDRGRLIDEALALVSDVPVAENSLLLVRPRLLVAPTGKPSLEVSSSSG